MNLERIATMDQDDAAGPTVLSFGCRLNLWEGEVMRGLARQAGQNDAVIINTCTVTAEAERQARQAIRKARRDHPEAPIIVTGCAVQRDPAYYAALPDVTRVLGNADKLEAAAWAGRDRVILSDLTAVRDTSSHLLDGFSANTRGFVEIQTGCDHRCSFCVIPLVRGPSRSVPVGGVVDAVRHLVRHGHHEVVLTGVDITGYGRDLPGQPGLGQLVRRLLTLVPDLARLRLSSVDPAEIDAELWSLIGDEPRLAPHLHLSVQAGDDDVLRRMARRHRRDDVLRVVDRARRLRPAIAFGADLIAGFPTETEAAFERSLSLIHEAGLDYLHVFPYSVRPGTGAASFPALSGAIVKARAARLRAAGEDAVRRRLAGLVGQTRTLLMERGGIGRTDCFAPVRPRVPQGYVLEPGGLIDVRLTGCADDQAILMGELV